MKLHKYKPKSHSHKAMRLNHSYTKPALGIGIFLFTFLSTLFISSSFAPVSDSNAEDIGAVINSSGYFINLASSNTGTVAIDLIATSGGSVGIAKNTINIKSNAPDGYGLYLSMDNKDTDGNRLYKDANPGPTGSPNPYLSPTSGTFDSPAPLDANSWGYALPSTTPGLPASTTPFDATYDPTAPNTNSLFAAMPLQGQEQLIQTITTPDSTNGIDTDVYYGVNANVSLPSGVYKGTVTYTAIARATTNTSSITAVSPSTTTKLDGGEALTITTMLGVNAADAEDSGDPSNGIPAKKISIAIGGQDCPVTGLSNAQDGSLLIHCTSPSMATGRYDVAVDIPKYDKFWVIVNGIQYKYTEQDQQTAIGQVIGGNATTNDILTGKSAFVNGVEILGTMPAYVAQHDSTKTEQENTQDAGITIDTTNNQITIAEGYHTQQVVSGPQAVSVMGELGTINASTSFDMKNIVEESVWKNLTTDNFLFRDVTVTLAMKGNGGGAQTNAANALTYAQYSEAARDYSLSYDAETGIVTAQLPRAKDVTAIGLNCRPNTVYGGALVTVSGKLYYIY